MKWVGRILVALLLIIAVVVVSLFFLPADRIARVAAQQIKAQTGREVSITGDVSMTIWPVLGVSAGAIEVGNADWSRQGPMLTAQNAAIGVDAAALLKGEIKITNIEATNPTIRLESRKDGRASWEFTDASGAAAIETETAPDREAQPFSLQRLSITDATLIYDAEEPLPKNDNSASPVPVNRLTSIASCKTLWTEIFEASNFPPTDNPLRLFITNSPDTVPS